MATNSSSILVLSLFDASLYRPRIASSTSVLVAVLISKRVSKKVLLVQTVNVCHRYGSRIMMFAKLCAPPLGPRPFDFAQGDSGTD